MNKGTAKYKRLGNGFSLGHYPKGILWDVTGDGRFTYPRIKGRMKRYYRKSVARKALKQHLLSSY